MILLFLILFIAPMATLCYAIAAADKEHHTYKHEI